MSVRSRFTVLTTAATLAVVPLALAPVATGDVRDTVRVSVASNGAGGAHGSFSADISPDGRYVVFVSMSENLVPRDRGPVDRDLVYLHDRVRHTTELVSPDRFGSSSPGFRLRNPVVSSGGRFVAFDSAAEDLVPQDDDLDSDVFVWDRREGKTALVSTPPVEGAELSASREAAISNDGRIVAYTSAIFDEDYSGLDRAIYAYDREGQRTELIETPEDGASNHNQISRPALSQDGRYVAFRTSTGYGTQPAASHVLVHDRVTDRTELVTELGGPVLANDRLAVSGDGRFVAFASSSDDLAPGDADGDADVFVHDRQTGSTEMVSVTDDGQPADGSARGPSLSADGRYVTFHSTARLSPADDDRFDDVYTYDRSTDRVALVSMDVQTDPRAGARAVKGSSEASVDDEGRHVVFLSVDRVTTSDTNRATDVFVHDQVGGPSPIEPLPFRGAPCPDRTSASVTCDTDRRDHLVLRGTGFDETLIGTGMADILRGGGGSDHMAAHAGPDRMYGGPGRDTLLGGAGRDRLAGGEAGDRLEGRSGRDWFWAGRGADRIDSGGQRHEVVDCGPSRDRVSGARGDRVHRDCERVRRG